MPCRRFGSQSRPPASAAMSERDSSYREVTSEALRDGDRRNGNREGGGPADLQALRAAVQFWAAPNPLVALRSLCGVIPDPLEGTPRRLDGTADRGWSFKDR